MFTAGKAGKAGEAGRRGKLGEAGAGEAGRRGKLGEAGKAGEAGEAGGSGTKRGVPDYGGGGRKKCLTLEQRYHELSREKPNVLWHSKIAQQLKEPLVDLGRSPLTVEFVRMHDVLYLALCQGDTELCDTLLKQFPVPSQLICPITYELIFNCAAIVERGKYFYFSRSALGTWFDKCKKEGTYTNPMTNSVVASSAFKWYGLNLNKFYQECIITQCSYLRGAAIQGHCLDYFEENVPLPTNYLWHDMRRAIKCNYAKGIHLISISKRLDWSILPKVAKYEMLRQVLAKDYPVRQCFAQFLKQFWYKEYVCLYVLETVAETVETGVELHLQNLKALYDMFKNDYFFSVQLCMKPNDLPPCRRVAKIAMKYLMHFRHRRVSISVEAAKTLLELLPVQDEVLNALLREMTNADKMKVREFCQGTALEKFYGNRCR